MPNKRKELLQNRAMRRSSINKAKKERDALMLSLDKKIRQAKLKENKIKKEIKANKIISKNKDKELKEKNSLAFEKQKQALRIKKEAIKIKNSTFKKQMASTSATIRADRVLNKKQMKEKLDGIRFAQKKDIEKRKKESEKIKAIAIQEKNKLNELKILEQEKRKKINAQREKVIAEEKVSIEKEKVKLKNLRSEKKMLEEARRTEKAEIARNARLEQEKVKEEARLKFREEISSIKYNKVSTKLENEKELKQEKEELNEVEDNVDEEVNKVIYDTKLSIEGMELEKEVAVNDLEIDYSYAFKETKPKEEQTKNLVDANIEGSTIASFGRIGMKKYKIANKDAVESDINKYKRLPELFNSIEKFRKIKSESRPIDIKTFKSYLELLLDVEITEEKFGVFQSHLVTSLLTKHSIKFANGYIENLTARGNNFVVFTRELLNKNSLISLSDKKLEKKSNELVLKKLKAGGNLQIAKGIIATMEGKSIVILQDTNFTKA